MNNFRRMLTVNILVLALLAGGAIAAVYFYNRAINYVTTNNARIDATRVTITPSASGQLIGWNGDIGKKYAPGERVGMIQPAVPGAPPVDVTFPMSATIVQQSAVKNSFVAAGTPLAYAYDMDNLYVTANINENDLSKVAVGQNVDITVDAFPGTLLSGKVNRIGMTTAGTFTLLPEQNTNANYTKVAQLVPISIALDGTKGLDIKPGLSANVRIHR
ncbi:HlyD family efflux transporter periplasmic adaptor subunit [Heliobacillus mobilis]|uniref:HlyD family efflux transporter periplasmic adaptor subunit n=1 Tax=Heliobacterium mobile TaxID=28064 RepID=A0A6I3SD17_HELMO|nr:HlyD family efflux transporter periplasmic adaptor subunit [Heliobacterium mobile]MTV47375.1 HlyD family efflux transporter periplasmic adaptor subunit [Heliobacterium mobile]